MSELIHARVQAHLQRLRLGHVHTRLDALLSEGARKDWTLLEFLDQLLSEEVSAKQGKRIAMGMQIAHFPTVKTLEGFDWLFQHEFSHEWFANQLTAANWDDYWLHEGFAQYMQPLYGRWREGEAAHAGQLDDHADLAWGSFELFLATHEPRWLERVESLIETMLARFWDESAGAFFDAAANPDGLPRLRSGFDGAELAGNSIAAEVLWRAGTLMERPTWIAHAERVFAYHARRAVAAFEFPVNGPDQRQHLRIRQALALRTAAVFPRPVAAYAHLQRRAHRRQPIGLPLPVDPRVLHRTSLAKYAVAFFKISFSILSQAFSARTRDSSICSGITCFALGRLSFPALSAFTQLRSVCSINPNSFATTAYP